VDFDKPGLVIVWIRWFVGH